MSSKPVARNKYPLLFVGLLAGLILGFGAALMLHNKQLRDTSDEIAGVHDTIDSGHSQGGKVYSGSGQGSRTPGDDTSVTDDTMVLDGGDYAETDTLFATTPGQDSLIVSIGDGGEMVRRDVMIGSRRIKPEYERPDRMESPSGATATDTLLTALTAVKPAEGIFSEYTLEFWHNPLNYTGYRVIRDKVVLFGMSPDQLYQLRVREGKLILVTGKREFHLRESAAFAPLTPMK
jgi:hypothetical protein